MSLFFIFYIGVIMWGQWSLAPTYWSKGGVDDITQHSRALWTPTGSVLSNTHVTHLVHCVWLCVCVSPRLSHFQVQPGRWVGFQRGGVPADWPISLSLRCPILYCACSWAFHVFVWIWWTLMRQWRLASLSEDLKQGRAGVGTQRWRICGQE